MGGGPGLADGQSFGPAGEPGKESAKRNDHHATALATPEREDVPSRKTGDGEGLVAALGEEARHIAPEGEKAGEEAELDAPVLPIVQQLLPGFRDRRQHLAA